MVRHIYTILAGLISFLMFTACEEPLIFDEVPFDNAKLVVVSNFTEGRSIIVKVSRSRLIGDPGPAEFLTDAQVDLFWNNEFLERLTLVEPPDPNQPPYYKTWENTPMTGLEYTLKVAAEGFKTVMARSTAPPSIKISRFDLEQSEPEILEGGSSIRHHLKATIDFNDPLSSLNYYHLNITQQVNNFVLEGKDTVITKSLLQPVVFDPLENRQNFKANSGELGGGLLFEDKPGNKALGISFTVDVNPAFQLLGKTYVELRTLSKDYYLFYTTVNNSDGGNPNPLSDPPILYENVENGHGIFAGYSNSLDSVQVAQ